MHVELKDGDHESAHAAASSAPVERRRNTKGLMKGTVITRPMSADAERRFHMALHRLIADCVALHLQGRGEREHER